MAFTLNEQLDEIVRLKEREAGAILSEALREGMKSIYRDAVLEAFLSGKMSRSDAVERLGEDLIRRAEGEAEIVRKDVEWGLHGRE